MRPAPARCRRHTVTGAAQKRFCVNTPAATVPSSNATSSTSSRCQFLIFAAAVPSLTPGTGKRSSGRAACSGRASRGFAMRSVNRATDLAALTGASAAGCQRRHVRRRCFGRRATPSDLSRHAVTRAVTRGARDSACISCPSRTGTDRCARSSRSPRTNGAAGAGAAAAPIVAVAAGAQRFVVVGVLVLDVGHRRRFLDRLRRPPACAPAPSARSSRRPA